jgi:PIN domain nuclease of toxin-antitoxin system
MESGANVKTVYLDTHITLFLYAGLLDKISLKAQKLIEEGRTLISPVVGLEIQYLHEIGRIKAPPKEVIAGLASSLNLEICQLPFAEVVYHSHGETWTRDVFDRIITAQARLENAPLITKDRLIREHYHHAI